MTTNVVTEDNFETMYPGRARDAFWDRVTRTLKGVFHVTDADAKHFVDGYRTSLERDGTTREQMFAYHEHPISVAANLAGIDEVTDDQQKLYRDLFGSDEPSQRGLP
jgi:hypothetical protein